MERGAVEQVVQECAEVGRMTAYMGRQYLKTFCRRIFKSMGHKTVHKGGGGVLHCENTRGNLLFWQKGATA